MFCPLSSPLFPPNFVDVCFISGESLAALKDSAGAILRLSQCHAENQNPRISDVDLMGLTQVANDVGLCPLSLYSRPIPLSANKTHPNLSCRYIHLAANVFAVSSSFQVYSISVLMVHYNLIPFIMKSLISQHIMSEGFIMAKSKIVALLYWYRICEGFLPRSYTASLKLTAMLSSLRRKSFALSSFYKERIVPSLWFILCGRLFPKEIPGIYASTTYLAYGLNEPKVTGGSVLMTILGDKGWCSTSRYMVTKLLCSGVTVRPLSTHSNLDSNLLSYNLSICFSLFCSLICICLRGCLILSLYFQV